MIQFEIPGAPPLLLNSRLHHMVKYRQSKKWYDWVHLALGRQIPAVPYPRAFIRYERHCGQQRPDQDNLVSGFKWVQDGLVLSGVIEEDREHNIETLHYWFPSSPKEKHIRVTLIQIL